MTQQRWLGAIVLGCALGGWVAAGATTANADGGFYCDAHVISTGNGAYRVQSLCGPPDDIQQRTEARSVRRQIKVPCAIGYCTTFVNDLIAVDVQEWTYDFGPRRFIQYLTFEQGTLVRVRSGAYGHKSIVSVPPSGDNDPSDDS